MGPGYQALRERVGYLDLSSRGKIIATGEDRVRLLHGHTSRYETLAAQYNRKIVPRTYPQERFIRRLARWGYSRVRRSGS